MKSSKIKSEGTYVKKEKKKWEVQGGDNQINSIFMEKKMFLIILGNLHFFSH